MQQRRTFEEFIQWYSGLTNPAKMKHYVSEFAEVSFDHSKVTDDFTSIEYMNRDRTTGEYEDGEENMDIHLYKLAQYYANNPTDEIIPQVNKGQVDKLLVSLRLAYKIADENEFYDSFQRYKLGISSLGHQLKSVKKYWDRPLRISRKREGEFGKKTMHAHKLRADLKLILEYDEHDEAIKALKRAYQEFKWPEPKELFMGNGKPNKYQITKALHRIAQLKFDDDIPGEQLIRTILLK